MKNNNVIVDKSKNFAIRIINLYKFLRNIKKEYVISKQILRSGTSIGANIKEAIYGFSKEDFVYKMNISLKEASETEYWLDLLAATDYITEDQYNSIHDDCIELIRLLTAIIKSTKTKN